VHAPVQLLGVGIGVSVGGTLVGVIVGVLVGIAKVGDGPGVYVGSGPVWTKLQSTIPPYTQ
jgi:hypothetical protein